MKIILIPGNGNADVNENPDSEYPEFLNPDHFITDVNKTEFPDLVQVLLRKLDLQY